VLRGQVTLRTPAKKWVYAQVDSDAPWLRVTTPKVSGPQQAAIAFEVDGGQLDAGAFHEATLRIAANAGQTLTLRVGVDVRRPREPIGLRLLRPFVAGALAALFLRLLLALPADLYARVWAGHSPDPGGPECWALNPVLDEPHYLKRFVLATWWVGVLLGAPLVWRRGGRVTDVACGAVAGAGAGLVGSATLACLMALIDALPRALLARMAAQAGDSSPWVWTPLWLFLTFAYWTVLGGGLGYLLCALGQRGTRLLTAFAWPLAGSLRLCGLGKAAAFFAWH
jgi:hypothetical protein